MFGRAQVGFGRKKKNACTENNLSVQEVWWRWRFHDVVGLFFLQRPQEPCWGTWDHELHEIPGHFKSESGCLCQETKLT